MRVFRILYWKELRSYFHSFVAYALMALVLLLEGVIISHAVSLLRTAPSQWSLLHFAFSTRFGFWLIFILVAPLITMRLFAEEQKLGTIETMLTAPVSTTQWMLAKFFSALTFCMLLYLPVLLDLFLFHKITGEPFAHNTASVFGAYLMLFLSGAMFISIGCFTSAITSNQVIAGFACFTILLILVMLSFARLLELSEPVIAFLDYLSFFNHMKNFCSGYFSTQPIVLCVSVTAFMLLLTHQALDYRRWRV